MPMCIHIDARISMLCPCGPATSGYKTSKESMSPRQPEHAEGDPELSGLAPDLRWLRNVEIHKKIEDSIYSIHEKIEVDGILISCLKIQYTIIHSSFEED